MSVALQPLGGDALQQHVSDGALGCAGIDHCTSGAWPAWANQALIACYSYANTHKKVVICSALHIFRAHRVLVRYLLHTPFSYYSYGMRPGNMLPACSGHLRADGRMRACTNCMYKTALPYYWKELFNKGLFSAPTLDHLSCSRPLIIRMGPAS